MSTDAGLGIVIVDHGSRREESNAMLWEMVRVFQERTGHAIVTAAHMELAEPTIEAAFSRCIAAGAEWIVVCPFFLSPGRHWDEDIPRLCAEAAARHGGVRYLVTAPLGAHHLLADLLQTRLHQCLGHSHGREKGCPS